MNVDIRTIDDVLPHLPQDSGFVVSERGGYTVIDYVYSTDGTFTNPVSHECRGLKFAPDGRILARPFHKFFNIGEREAPDAIDWSRPHVVMDKLDGSMIHPCQLGDDLVFMTRMGITDQAKAARARAADNVLTLAADQLAQGRTAIFEYTSPDNRIVVSYAEARMTLLAVRDTITGRYMLFGEMVALADRHGVPVVGMCGQVGDIHRFIADGRALEGVEGYVIAFDDGHRVKLKADSYVLRHKALAGLAHEKNLLAWVAEDALDDVLPLLAEDIAARVRAYAAQVTGEMSVHLAKIEALVALMADADRRTFAMAVQERIDPRLQKVAFAVRDGKCGAAAMKSVLGWAAHSEARVEAYRDLFQMDWFGHDLIVRDI